MEQLPDDMEMQLFLERIGEKDYKNYLGIDKKIPVSTEKEALVVMLELFDALEKRYLKEKNLYLKEAYRFKVRFLENIGHEVRTPLNGIMGMTDLLLDLLAGSSHTEKLEIIKNNSNNLMSLINDIIDFSKLETGKVQIDNKACALEDLLQNVIDLLGPYASSKGILLESIIESFEDGPFYVFLDDLRLRQVLINLVKNGIKFTLQGKVTLRIGISKLPTDKYLVTFSVEDTGIGIKEDLVPHIFDKFSKDDRSLTREYDGLGLGLTICQELVSLLGGKIYIESKEGVGSKFYFTLEFDKASKEEIGGPENPFGQIKGCFAEKCPANILIAEDNKINQKVVVSFLERLGYFPTVVENGEEAVNALENDKINFVLMDCHMPKMDGLEATKIIREKYPHRKVMIVALTASVNVQTCLDAGMNAYLSKPIKVRELMNVLRALLEK